MYVDTNYKHYNTTIRRTESGLQLRTLEPTKKIQKPPLPERKYKPEPFKLEPIETKKENKLPSILPQLITHPRHINASETIYQHLSLVHQKLNNIIVYSTTIHMKHLYQFINLNHMKSQILHQQLTNKDT